MLNLKIKNEMLDQKFNARVLMVLAKCKMHIEKKYHAKILLANFSIPK